MCIGNTIQYENSMARILFLVKTFVGLERWLSWQARRRLLVKILDFEISFLKTELKNY